MCSVCSSGDRCTASSGTLAAFDPLATSQRELRKRDDVPNYKRLSARCLGCPRTQHFGVDLRCWFDVGILFWGAQHCKGKVSAKDVEEIIGGATAQGASQLPSMSAPAHPQNFQRSLHTAELGITAHVLGNIFQLCINARVFGATVDANAKNLASDLDAWEKREKTPNRFNGQLTKDRICSSNSWPKLHTKGAHCAMPGPVRSDVLGGKVQSDPNAHSGRLGVPRECLRPAEVEQRCAHVLALSRHWHRGSRACLKTLRQRCTLEVHSCDARELEV